ncbi:aminotransferase class III-fold pyridoxal phosphate-dependent enzyme [Pseudorhodoferax sp. Leaf267]|uniref:aminotransferase class III-fold pyridoxal phosphate-dependent enzyme n=1 Tax=Pseudorhodoferax sp. Leaf267 TaxID=1736316 RepID=UPI0006FC2F64|nr:aminotransferase class III-fold pyridoxal phosphate-dependent enzyme [Pseudorhodoferax sp. Leaf267]KQP18446.1 glutamate-1-semialdehyde 2,1-aminomutase [Pseudorhodoferax sp. Leaf267]
MNDTTLLAGLGLAALAALLPAAHQRLALSRAKHRSLAGHSKLARRVARRLPFYDFGPERFFDSDGAPAAITQQRRAGLVRLSALFEQRFARTLAMTEAAREGIADLQFTSRYRVPFQYSRTLRASLQIGGFVERSSGVQLIDVDGNALYDLAGSYGVNLLGYDFYKSCIAEGSARVQELGPVLGSYHPAVLDNMRRLRAISGMDEVSFHMSGTEAVMQAVRLARYHTGRTHIVRFCGAYHGWWDDVQPGIGNPLAVERTYTLRDLHARSLAVLKKRRDIACVLVNPLQALHPNANAPSDSSLVAGRAPAQFDRAAYTAWLQQLREVCTARGIVLIFDEVFLGFRLAPGGAQEYFGVKADLVTYGKTLGGGLPVGVVCGPHRLMQRWRHDKPADICFARGTFNAHPYVMGAMQVFLERLETPEVQALYQGLDATWEGRATRLNAALERADLPVRVSAMSTVWSVGYTQASRYHWMLQFYLRAQGLALSWVGTGRLIFSLNYGDAEFDEVMQRFVAGCEAMRADGWWWQDAALTKRSIARSILREMWGHRGG